MSKIYMIVEAQVDGQTLQSEKFNQLFNPDTEDVGFSEVFNMTDSKEFSDYEKKDDFIDIVLGMACELFVEAGEEISDITFLAIEEGTEVFRWGINILEFDEETVQYEIVDWNDGEHIFKFEN